MAYKRITQKLLSLVEDSRNVLEHLDNFNNIGTISFGLDRERDFQKGLKLYEDWIVKTIYTLKNEGLHIESLQIENLKTGGRFLFFLPLSTDLKDQTEIVRKACSILLRIAEKYEERQEGKTVHHITVEDLDSFNEYYQKAPVDIDEKYFDSVFLEDDVEEAFLEILGEPYKEFDSGAETRDLYTSRLVVQGKRKHAVFLLKGRGVKRSMNITDCGKNGDQLLKLSKNSFASVFVIQHVNKIESEVLEALQDHVLAHSNSKEIYICSIDGVDTAKILAGLGKDLEELINNKSVAGRKKKSNIDDGD